MSLARSVQRRVLRRRCMPYAPGSSRSSAIISLTTAPRDLLVDEPVVKPDSVVDTDEPSGTDGAESRPEADPPSEPDARAEYEQILDARISRCQESVAPAVVVPVQRRNPRRGMVLTILGLIGAIPGDLGPQPCYWRPGELATPSIAASNTTAAPANSRWKRDLATAQCARRICSRQSWGSDICCRRQE